MKSLMSFLLGIVLTILGAFIFLSNITVSNFTFFYRYNDINITALLMLALCVLFVVYIVHPNIVTGGLLGLVFLLFVVSIILSMKFYIKHITALELMIVLATFFGGIGLTLRGVLQAKDYTDQNSAIK